MRKRKSSYVIGYIYTVIWSEEEKNYAENHLNDDVSLFTFTCECI